MYINDEELISVLSDNIIKYLKIDKSNKKSFDK
jgi:hypothetical protein